MKKLQVRAPATICDNPSSPFRYFGWPSALRLPDGALAMACSGFRVKHICPFGKAVICYSRDEGLTWTRPAAVIDTPLDDRDCGLTAFGNGRVMLTSFNNTLDFQRSVNACRGGVNNTIKSSHKPANEQEQRFIEAYLDYAALWKPEERFLGSEYCVSDDGGYTFGDVRRAPVTAPHGPCRLNDGSLLYVGRRFSGDDSYDSGVRPYLECWRLNEKDEWEYVSSIENVEDEDGLLRSCEPHAIQLPDGKIVVHIRVQRGGEHRIFTLYQSESEDNGGTFTRPRQLLGDWGGSPAHLMRHSDGTLVSVYGYREKPYGIRAMFSRDGGETWDADWVLYDGGVSGDLGYPCTVERGDGSLLTVYYENIGDQSVIRQLIWNLPG